ncbi:uncharacterized protein LOC135376503 [Ornithodoros turicata]|uniref:uncharacterized protein LOC135376503 n=1 Tax=Ornithodoros turicata TaxID=34597 RepID=UPI003139A813
MHRSPTLHRYDLRSRSEAPGGERARSEERLVSNASAPSEPKGPAEAKEAHAVPSFQATSTEVPAVPQSDAIATAELLSRMTELCSLVVQRMVAGSVSPPQAQAPLRLNLPVPTFSGYTDKKSIADFLDDLTAYQTAVSSQDTDFPESVGKVTRHLLPVRVSRTADHRQRNLLYNQHHRDWDLRLAELAFATRTTVNRSTGFTPAFLNLGREAPFPVENALGLRDGGTRPPYSRFAEDLRSRLDDAARTARENLDVARLDQARQYNRGRRNLTYSVGDLVLRRTHPLSDASRGFAASLADRWDGPFEVSACSSGLTYRLRRCDTGEETGPVHISDLKSYHLRDPDGEEPDSQPASLQDLDPDPVPGPASSRYDLRPRRRRT